MNCRQQINTSNKSEMENKLFNELAEKMMKGEITSKQATKAFEATTKKKAVKKLPAAFTKRVEWCPLGYTHFAEECEKLKCKEHHAAHEAHAKKIQDERQVMISQGFDYIYIHDLRKWLWVHEDILSGWECQRGCV